jgi:putative Flp pilus-assembly TadE/G-like protein
MRRQEGQIIPALVMVMLSLIAVGMLFFQVGRAAIFSTEAQTAADAAALAAAKNIQAQLTGMVFRSGTSELGFIDDAQVRAEAERYASKNGAHVVRLERNGVDVRVWVSTKETLGDGAKSLGKEDTRGEAHARARLELQVIPGSGSLGPAVTGGDPTISDREWNRLKKKIGSPPVCNDSKNDLVPLGQLLRAHGFSAGENADLGDNPAPGVHSATGYHYRCHNSAAIDLNHDQGNEGAVLDALVEPLHRLGFRTLWRTTGHFDHMHIDVAASPSIGAGFGPGGAVGGLEETMLDVRLIDWNAAELPFGGLGGAGGSGFFGGAPDAAVAGAICQVLDRLDAPPKVQLAAFEAAIVESGVHNLSYGDRDSLGAFQQRPSAGWGTPAQILDPVYASTQFITRAIRANGSQSPGQLAQDVQISAFPDRYDGVAVQAAGLLQRFCG